MFKNLLKKKDFSFLETYTTFGHTQRWWNYLRRSHKTIGLVSNTDSCHYTYLEVKINHSTFMNKNTKI